MQALPNAFEIFGVDFLLDELDMKPLLLELVFFFLAWRRNQFKLITEPLRINGGPDFAQTGERLNDLIETLFEGTVELAVKPFLQKGQQEDPSSSAVLRHFRQCLGTDVRPTW